MSTEEQMTIKERLYYNSFQPYSAKQKKEPAIWQVPMTCLWEV